MKNKKLIILAAACLLATVGCGPQTSSSSQSGSENAGPAEKSHYDDSKSIKENMGFNDEDELQREILGAYDLKYNYAASITDPTKTVERYQAFAEAEYSLIYEEAIIVPWLTGSGYSASVSNTVPYQAGRASYGLQADKLKNLVVTPNAITKEERAAVVNAWEEGKKTVHTPTVDAQGYTSLENKNANGAISGGKYTYGGKTFTTKAKYLTTYTTDPTDAVMNYLTNNWTYNSEHYCNFVDGLVENDKYGNIVGAIATGYKVENLDNGDTKWTFKLREDAKWIDPSDKSEKGAVTAHDFVTALKYVLDPVNGSGTASIPMSVVKGATEYYASLADEKVEDLDFSTVGIKAESDYVLSYTLKGQVPYFLSMLTYSPFLPVSADLLAAKGASFGSTMNNIWCNGAFLPKTYVAQSQIVYEKNAKYYDAAHVYVDEVVKTFVPSTATFTTTREWYEAGTIDAFSVRSQDVEGYKKYVLGEDGSGTVKNPADPKCNGILSVGSNTYIGYFNFDRWTYEVNDQANAKTFDEKVNTAKALANKNFRKAFLYGLDVVQMLKTHSEEEPHNYLMRGYTNRELCSANNKDYADYVDEVYNRKQGTQGVTLTGINNNGVDPVFDTAKAKAFFAAAKAELIANGMKEGDFPIKVDVISNMDVEIQLYEKAMYAALSEAGEGVIEIQFNVPNSSDQNTQWGSVTANYDFSMWSGWGPDYADPNTYLHTMCIDGDMVEMLGFGDNI